MWTVDQRHGSIWLCDAVLFFSCDFQPLQWSVVAFLVTPQIPSPWLLQTRKSQVDLLWLMCIGQAKTGETQQTANNAQA
jgi:hypothetical protein